MNVVVLRGVASSDARRQSLPCGSQPLQIELTTCDDRGATTVPVAWFDAPASAKVSTGDERVVLGRVRRRFFRTGNATTSRTEVLAERVVPASRATAASGMVERAIGLLGG
jgi:hypothetical protein